MTGAFPWRRLAGTLLVGRKARVDIYATTADLLDSGFSLERALSIAVEVADDQGRRIEARVLAHWRAALLRGRFAEEIRLWVPASEAMILTAYGRVDARHLFDGAARVADLQDRQMAAVRAALAMPALLFATLVVMFWGAGGYFMPVLAGLVPQQEWPVVARAFHDVSVWLHGHPLPFAAGLASLAAGLGAATLAWTGPFRAAFDRLAPFSLYRTVVGSAFLFVLLEYMRAGIDLNSRTFEHLKRSASPYTRHRIAAIQGLMARGHGLGASMIAAGHGFPDPSLAPVVAALDGIPDWESRLARFVDRWISRSEALLKARTAILNAVLLLVATAIAGGGIQSLFAVMDAAGRAGSGGFG